MRNAIRTKLMKEVPGITDVYEPHAASVDSKPPYLVIRQGVDAEDTAWLGFRRVVEIWPYVSQTTFTKVDDLEKTIISSLEKSLVTDEDTGEAFSCVYLGTAGPDVVDRDWGVITRGLRFAVLALQPLSVQEQVASDPWIKALATWTQDMLGDPWEVYQNRFPFGYKRPSILWRLNDYGVECMNRAGFVVRKEIVGHILSLSPNEQTNAAVEIIEHLSSSIKIPLDKEKRTYLTVVTPRADLKADGLNTGQITVTFSRRTSRPKDDAPFMQEIGHRSDWR